jgi:hypothetical protein
MVSQLGVPGRAFACISLFERVFQTAGKKIAFLFLLLFHGLSYAQCRPQKTNRVAIATFWRTFHYDGKISPAW